MKTANGIPFVKSPGVEGVDFDLMPRKGLNTSTDIEKATKYIHDTQHKVSEIRVTWLPYQSVMPSHHSNTPHFLVRIQNPSGGINPFKRAIWASIDVGEVNVKFNLYDGSPGPSNLLPDPSVVVSDGKTAYSLAIKELVQILESDKTILKINLK